MYACFREGFFDFEGLASWLFSTWATIGLYLGYCLIAWLGRLTELGFGVLLTDLFVGLVASINLEKEG